MSCRWRPLIATLCCAVPMFRSGDEPLQRRFTLALRPHAFQTECMGPRTARAHQTFFRLGASQYENSAPSSDAITPTPNEYWAASW